MAWQPSESDAGVRNYQITRDDGTVFTTTQTYFRDTTASRSATHVYTVIAVNNLGNRSEASNVASPAMLDLPAKVIYRSFQGNWSQLPDFSNLIPGAIGTIPNFDLTARPRDNDYAMEFFGQIDAPATGSYTFYTASDDGSQLWIDDQLVVDNDGLHPAWERSGQKTLTVGMHDIRVTHFQAGGGQSLAVAWEGPGFAKQAIADSSLYHALDTQATNTPRNVVATPAVHSISMAWLPATDNWQATGYNVYRGTSTTGLTLLATTTAPVYCDTTAQPGVSYFYSVAALDAAQNVSAPSTPIAASNLNLPAGLIWHTYSGAWSQMPSFGSLVPQTGGITGHINLDVTQQTNDYALQFTGQIETLQAGTYTFYTNSDDGSRLWIDGQSVVDNDGLHGNQDRSGSIYLAVGMHTIAVGYFQGGGGQALSVAWEGPGFTKREIPTTATFHTPDTQAPTAPQNLVVTPLAGSVSIAWTAAQDDVGVDSYEVLRNGHQIGTTTQTYFRDADASASSDDRYTVVARDQSLNASLASQEAPGVARLAMPAGLVYNVYYGTWSQMPDFVNWNRGYSPGTKMQTRT